MLNWCKRNWLSIPSASIFGPLWTLKDIFLGHVQQREIAYIEIVLDLQDYPSDEIHGEAQSHGIQINESF